MHYVCQLHLWLRSTRYALFITLTIDFMKCNIINKQYALWDLVFRILVRLSTTKAKRYDLMPIFMLAWLIGFVFVSTDVITLVTVYSICL